MLTAARARESKDIRSNSRRGKERLEGVVPVIEDWHAKLCFLEVCCVCVCVHSLVCAGEFLRHMHVCVCVCVHVHACTTCVKAELTISVCDILSCRLCGSACTEYRQGWMEERFTSFGT